ncbi:MAG: hypothetical protein AAF607_08460 [Pseudomonadota bacterium]
MKRIMLIDDDSHEAVFWQHIVRRDYADKIALACYTDVDEAIAALDEFQPDVVLLDNRVPPHETAQFGLSQLRDRKFEGDIFVWSFTDKDLLDSFMKHWPEVETLAKQDYVGIKVRDLIETKLIAVAA